MNGEDSYGSVFGACSSLIIALVLATYGVHKFFIMWNYEDTNFNEFSVKNELSDREFSSNELLF